MGQVLCSSVGLAVVLSLCVSRVLAGAMTIGDVVAIHGMLLQLHVHLQATSHPMNGGMLVGKAIDSARGKED